MSEFDPPRGPKESSDEEQEDEDTDSPSPRKRKRGSSKKSSKRPKLKLKVGGETQEEQPPVGGEIQAEQQGGDMQSTPQVSEIGKDKITGKI